MLLYPSMEIFYTSTDLKNLSKIAVLDLIRFTREGISRADIARQLGVSRSAISHVVSEFMEQGLVIERDVGASAGGRRPVLLGMNGKLGYLVGIDLGASHGQVIISDFAAQVVAEQNRSLDITLGPEECMATMESMASAMLRQNGISVRQIRAVGISVPGPVIQSQGMVLAPPIMPGWSGFPIRGYFESLWQCPVVLGNDAEFGALGEWVFGAGMGESYVVYIKVGTGVGAGFVINGRIYRGVNGSAGEIGHITLVEDGPRCKCGNRGCLEALSGGGAIAQRAIQAVKNGEHTTLAEIAKRKTITTMDVAAAARRGDLVAQKIIHDAGEYLGMAVSNLINLFNPGVVIIGGGVAQIGDLFLEPMRVFARKNSLRASSQSVRITAAMLGNRSTALGAIVQAQTLALSDYLE